MAWRDIKLDMFLTSTLRTTKSSVSIPVFVHTVPQPIDALFSTGRTCHSKLISSPNVNRVRDWNIPKDAHVPLPHPWTCTAI
ncbi:hypothetical protein EMCRGX_G033483 [Ephydatia muelleri]